MTKELIEKLQPYVTAFSTTVENHQKHGDKVVVGGVVTHVLNMVELLSGALEEEFKTDGIYIMLDDGVGEISLCLAPKAYDIYVQKFGPLEVGKVILAEGMVFRLDTTHSYEGARGKKVTVDKHEKDTVRVLGYQAAPLPEDKPKRILTVKE
jgi:hypothetical protein